MTALHKVQRYQLEDVNKWLKDYLPESWAFHGLIKSILDGRWTGFAIYTLGWPVIRGVATGSLEADHPCPDYDSCIGNGFLYAPKQEDIAILLNHQAIVDWSKPFAKAGIPQRIAVSLREKALAMGCLGKCSSTNVHTFFAKPGDIELRPVPTGYRIRSIKLDSEIDYCVSTWKYATPYTDQYLRALTQRFPSICITDDQDRCLSFEMGTEHGAIGFLHTKEEERRRGLAKVVVSHMAAAYHKLHCDVLYACAVEGNEVTFSFHKSMGFTHADGTFCYFQYDPSGILTRLE